MRNRIRGTGTPVECERNNSSTGRRCDPFAKYRTFIVTDFELSNDWKKIATSLDCWAAVGQIEEGGETNRKHWQVCLYWRNPVNMRTTKNLIKAIAGNRFNLTESIGSTNSDVRNMMHYCQKPIQYCTCSSCQGDGVVYENTRFQIGNVKSSWFSPKQPKKESLTAEEAMKTFVEHMLNGGKRYELLDVHGMRGYLRNNIWLNDAQLELQARRQALSNPCGPLTYWQQRVVDELLEDWDNRRFWWVYSKEPGVGKNWLKDVIINRYYPAIEAKFRDDVDEKQILHNISMLQDIKVIVVTIPRQTKLTRNFWTLLETLVDGVNRGTTGMYGATVSFKCHVVIMSNYPWSEEMERKIPGRARIVCADPEDNPREEYHVQQERDE